MYAAIPILAALASAAAAAAAAVDVVRVSTYTDSQCGRMNAITYINPGRPCETLTAGTPTSVINDGASDGVVLLGYTTEECQGEPAVTISTGDCQDISAQRIISWKAIF